MLRGHRYASVRFTRTHLYDWCRAHTGTEGPIGALYCTGGAHAVVRLIINLLKTVRVNP